MLNRLILEDHSFTYRNMLAILLFVLSTLLELCQSQVVYMPRYVVRRSAMDTLERLRLPAARYFPQVESQAAQYQGPFVAGYPIREVYSPPNQWADEYPAQQMMAAADDEEGDYGNYEYPDLAPSVYRAPPQFGEEVYAQDDSYGNLMDRYLMGQAKEEMLDVPRRRTEHSDQKEDTQNSTTTSAPSTQKTVQMTAVPPAPEKKDMKSLVVPDQQQRVDEERGEGQKEEPLFRPLQSSQRTMWTKAQKSPIPLLKKIIQQAGPAQKKLTYHKDTLYDELADLKRKKTVF